MASQFEYGKLSSAEDIQQLEGILSQCFNSLGESTYLKRIGTENMRIVRQAERIAGGLAILHMGQWYGSQTVPMAGIAAVGIAPEYRGSGAAIALLQKTLRELHSSGVPISVLYPATQRLYRKVHYEQGGFLCTWQVAAQDIHIKDYSLPVQVVPIDSPILVDVYRQQAKNTNGNLDRNQVIWEGVREQQTGVIVKAYLIGSEAQPEGYIIIHQRKDGNSNVLGVDWSLLTSAAVRRFWTFLADHRSQIDLVCWRSSPSDALALMLPEQSAKVASLERWMLRLLDVSKALEKRGYPTMIETELHLEIRDEFLVDNDGKFVLSVSGGRGSVTRGGRGDMKLNVSSLSPLYTGLFTPQQLRLAGQLESTDSALLAAAQLFAGTPPWMADFF